MILVLAYWCLLLWLFGVFGSVTQYFFKTTSHPVVTLLLGMFSVAMLASTYSFFGGLGIYFEGSLFAASLLLTFAIKSEILNFFISLKAKISSLTVFSKFLLTALVLLCALKSASIPFLIDNESYYLQTIQWLDDYGLVKGVANLHPFLLQFSGWHILQSATNLDFLQLPINDLSGFALIIGLFYAIDKADLFYTSKTTPNLYAGFFVFFSLFAFQFIAQPSPDVIIYIITVIVFYESYLCFYKKSIVFESISIIFVLAVFAIFCKLTALVLVLFPVSVLILKRRTFSRKHTIPYLIPLFCAVVAGVLFLAKNHIISGYLTFPLNLSIGNPDWKVPDSIVLWYLEQTQLDAFQIQDTQFFTQRFSDRFAHWITLPGLDGIFNTCIVLVLVVFPLVLWIKKWNRMLLILYGLSVLQFLLIWNNAPQFRFFFAFFALLLSVGATIVIRKSWLVKVGNIVAILLVAVPLLIPLQLGNLSSTSFLASTKPFEWKHIIIPHPNSRYVHLEHKIISYGNTLIKSPVESPFFWGTGDCEVPCVNMEQLSYFEKYFSVIPQQRTDDLSDGFYAKPIANE